MLPAIAPWVGLARAAATGCSTRASRLRALHSLLDRRSQAPGGVLRFECDGKADIRVSPGEHESVSIQVGAWAPGAPLRCRLGRRSRPCMMIAPQAEGPADGVTVQVEQQEQRQLIGERPRWSHAMLAAARTPQAGTPQQEPALQLTLADARPAVLRQSSAGPAAITALAPERWCTIEASTHGARAASPGVLLVRGAAAARRVQQPPPPPLFPMATHTRSPGLN
jgi:hypothetical protein